MPQKRMSYTNMFKDSTKSLKLLYPTLALSKKLNPNAKSFTPKKHHSSLDIRNVSNLLKPGVRGLNPLAKTFKPKLNNRLNPLAKPFFPKKSHGKKNEKNNKNKNKSQKRKRRVTRKR